MRTKFVTENRNGYFLCANDINVGNEETANSTKNFTHLAKYVV